MMDMSELAVIAVVLIMVVMCGGMITGASWGILWGRERQ
jgi:hypothetical protein